MVAAAALVALLAALVVFQVCLALGAPWGRLAWGGQHPGVLPAGLRVGSALSVAVYALVAVVALDRAGAIDVLPTGAAEVAMWVVVGFLALGALANLASRSKPERVVMTPVAAVLAVLALLVAL